MADDILGKADSLMRRHRAFVADEGSAAVPPGDLLRGVSPAPTFSAADAEDLPVLTEVVAGVDTAATDALPSLTATAAADIETALRDRLAALQPQQREMMRRELAAWLDEQLPQLVMRVLDGVTDQLVAQINTQARVTLLPKLQAVLEGKVEPPPEA